MIDGTAGGHTFHRGVCNCGAYLADLQWVDPKKDAGKPNIAHTGLSTVYECEQLAELGQKMRDQVNVLFGWRD